jgi:sugar phosphate isomerase/epimerase
MKERPLGIVEHSYTQAWKPDSGSKFHNALTFLEYAHSIGAGGVQVGLKPAEQPDAAKIRARAEELGAWFEGNLSLPKTNADLAAFEAAVQATVTAGATIARLACLGGRRYETFKTLEEFRAFKNASWNSLALAEPILKKHKLKLGIENHKDWTSAEHVELLRHFSSEWIGACIDTGNSISLLEDPYEVIEALAPFAVTSHIKDMGVREYEDGFLLSEVPFGEGFLDIPRIIQMLRKHNPAVRLNLEMITRDPLKVPCLTENYYATFDQPRARQLASTLALVKAHSNTKLPQTTGLDPAQRLAFEDQNVRKCIAWTQAHS